MKRPFLIAATTAILTSQGFATASLSTLATPALDQRRVTPLKLAQSPYNTQRPLPPATSNPQQPLSPTGQSTSTPAFFGLPDGTPIKVKFKQEISSKTAQVNDPVEFSVSEDIRVGNTVVIAQGATARGVVTKVIPSGMLGRKGKLTIDIKDVDLVTGERVALRSAEKNGGGHAGGVIALAAVVNPLFLLMKGKSATFAAGTETTGYVNGNFALSPAQFRVAR